MKPQPHSRHEAIVVWEWGFSIGSASRRQIYPEVSEFGARKLLRLLEVLGHELSFTRKSSGFTLDDALAQRQAQVPDSTLALPRGARR